MGNFFKLKEHGTNTRTELIAGATTFFTMAYIIVVNPLILGDAGMSAGGVFVATIIAAVIGTLIMGLFANVPYALAPGMGMNAFFTYTVCMGMGFKWQEALGIVFISGIIAVIVTVTKVRRILIQSIPKSLQHAIGAALGLFIAFIGLLNSGLISISGAVPEMASLGDAGHLLTLLGLAIIIILLVLKVRAAIFIGIIATTIIGIPMGVVNVSGVDWFSFSKIGDVKDTAFSFFGSPGLGSIFSDPTKIFMALTAIFAVFLSDLFDTVGTFIGTGRVSGIFDDKDEKDMVSGTGLKLNSKMERALLADCTGTVVGSLVGTSNTTTYVESAAGIGAGGRTGLTSVATAVCLLICLPFSGIVSIIPYAATAPALICVGVMMMGSIKDVNWGDFEEAAPVFLTMAFTAFAYSISYGIAAGLIFYCLIKVAKGKLKELNPLLCGATLLFILNFVVRGLQDAGII